MQVSVEIGKWFSVRSCGGVVVALRHCCHLTDAELEVFGTVLVLVLVVWVFGCKHLQVSLCGHLAR
jgi:hypothetical protein